MKCRSLSLSLSLSLSRWKLSLDFWLSFRYFSKAVAARDPLTSTEKSELNFSYTSDRLGKIRPREREGEALIVVAVSRPTYCLLFHNFAFNQVCAMAASVRAGPPWRCCRSRRRRAVGMPIRLLHVFLPLSPSLPPSFRVRLFLPYQL